ncbi:hypothetical protein FACS189441_5310 [Betaproteobacteria bacterium]|nr:hypothetical protein FACS189441_5310 [Betaproteobacteria bacterium]
MGIINTKGEWLIEPRFGYASNFESNGLARAGINENGRVGFINKEGEWVIKPKFAGVTGFGDSDFAVANSNPADSRWNIVINKKGEQVLGPYFGTITDFDRHGRALLTSHGNSRKKLIDIQGNVLAIHDYIGEFNEYGIATYQDGSGETNRIGLIDINGKSVLPREVIEVRGYYQSWGGVLATITVEKKGRRLKGLIDQKAHIITEPVFDNIGYDSDRNFDRDGFVRVEKSGKWGLVNNKGEIVLDAIADNPVYFDNENGLTIVKVNGKSGVLNKKGQWVIKPRFGYIHESSVARGGLILALDKNPEDDDAEEYFLDLNGNIVLYSETVEGTRVIKNAKGEILTW